MATHVIELKTAPDKGVRLEVRMHCKSIDELRDELETLAASVEGLADRTENNPMWLMLRHDPRFRH